LEAWRVPGPGFPHQERDQAGGGAGMKREILTDENGEPIGIAYTLDNPEDDGAELFNELTRLLGDD